MGYRGRCHSRITEESSEQVTIAARDFPILTMPDIVKIQEFFKNGIQPDRTSVALYMLAYGVAASVGFQLKLISQQSVSANQWPCYIVSKDRKRSLVVHVAIDPRHVVNVPMTVEQIVANEAPPANVHDRKWNVTFGSYNGAVDLDVPNALRQFYVSAAQEIVLNIRQT